MKELNSLNLLTTVRESFAKVKDTSRRKQYSLQDCLMSGYALFSLKYASLLQFDQQVREDIIKHNLSQVYQLKKIPSDTQFRERLDLCDPRELRKTFRRLFALCQRSKKLEYFKYYDDHYLLPLDGTGYFYSKEIHCEHCCEKHHKDGSISYYHQMLCGVIAHPEQKVVLPFAPEMIMKGDGHKKNDCEHRAAERFLSDLQREHPHLKVIITGDGLYPDGPFIKRLKQDKHHFILVAKEKDLKYLFEEFRALPQQHYELKEDKVTHRFAFANGHPLNDSHHDCPVNVLEYWEIHESGFQQHWVWVTDIELSEKNVFTLMRGGRTRHKIENETFNTLKNQGYQFEHNFGHGYHNLSTVLAHLMLIAFFVDQLQQSGCKLFQKALIRLHSKKSLWERLRSYFFNFFIDSIDDLWASLAHGHQGNKLTPNSS